MTYKDLNGNDVTLNIDDPDEGVYVGVPMHVYLRINAMSRSAIKLFREAPEHFEADVSRETAATIFGTQYHAYVYQPDLFEREFVNYSGQRRYGKAYDELLQSHPSHMIYLDQDLAQMRAMKQALVKYPISSRLLTGGGIKEVVVVAVCPHSGFKMKICIDSPLYDQGIMADLKTTSDDAETGFAYLLRSGKYGYDLQPPFYRYVCSLTPKMEHFRHFWFVVQEKKAEHGYKVRRHEGDTSERKVDEVIYLLQKLRAWDDEGRPYPDELIRLPIT